MLLVAIAEHGMMPTNVAARMTLAADPDALQAAVAACHARAPRAEATDWARIVALYEAMGLSRESKPPGRNLLMGARLP